ncbi:PREDICTED: probable serine/threonine-protein kinase At1g09600 isoform X1 [Prunus mume]|uniref:Probable serine/threonine-protein kinase At1g09600 isoform X1 n=1 Tax=Prunus mume TaxID=102107 RepID=A0ABM0N3P9_PRUMU|nr:PREDICTED: probable serine/threonine-protein kinase At1g09600 isoform X1 [Prunus mume]
MGCICSKGASEQEKVEDSDTVEHPLKDYSVQLVAPTPSLRDDFVAEVSGLGGGGGGADGSVRLLSNTASRANRRSNAANDEDPNKTQVISKPGNSNHQRWATMDMEASEKQTVMSRIVSMPHGAEGEQTAAGWPSWLTSVAGDAIKGWVPRRADSFEKLDKIGQGTYSSVYKARDLETGKIVALKKVRFVNMDPESVRFMAREIHILRRLDHPNVMKLEGLVTSRVSCSLYLVFEYMEHDLSGLAAIRGNKFTEAQIKCYMQQLLLGLEHCHSRGVLHRDIKGSNLLLDNDGVLKIGDFGLATFYEPGQKEPLTSRVVTLWFRAPELLLGATAYGDAIDLWSTGCILAEMYAGKPIMPGRTEVEQMHKIFKLCGSPSEDFWKKTKLPHATSFKPQQPYKRRIADTFKELPSSSLALIDRLLSIEPEKRGSAASALSSEFFTTQPLPCNPSNLPKYPPSKEFDAKLRDEEKRRKVDAFKGRGTESVRRSSRDTKAVPTPEFNAQGDASLQQGQRNLKTTGHKYMPQRDSVSGFAMEPSGGARQNGYSHCSSMIHPSAVESSLNKTVSTLNKSELRTQKSHKPQAGADFFISSNKKDERVHSRDSRMGYVPKNRIHYSGPLVPPGGNIEDMLKEHERQIQQAVRKARAR